MLFLFLSISEAEWVTLCSQGYLLILFLASAPKEQWAQLWEPSAHTARSSLSSCFFTMLLYLRLSSGQHPECWILSLFHLLPGCNWTGSMAHPGPQPHESGEQLLLPQSGVRARKLSALCAWPSSSSGPCSCSLWSTAVLENLVRLKLTVHMSSNPKSNVAHK